MADFFTAMEVSAQGMTAERTRMNVASSNLANATTTQTPEGGPFKRLDVILQSQHASNNVSGGVRSSWPAQNGQSSSSSDAIAVAPGRRVRPGATATQRPVDASRRRSATLVGRSLVHRSGNPSASDGIQRRLAVPAGRARATSTHATTGHHQITPGYSPEIRQTSRAAH